MQGRMRFRRTVVNVGATLIGQGAKIAAEGIVIYMLFQQSINAGLLGLVAAVIPMLGITVFEKEEPRR